jgi:predicted ATPase
MTCKNGGHAPTEWAELIHQRTGGHPLFARELCRLLAAGGVATETPAAVREVIVGRLTRLSTQCAALLNAAAVAGNVLLTDVLAEVAGETPTGVLGLTDEAQAAGILVPAGSSTDATRFAHDLYRETIYAQLPPGRRLELHHRVAIALLARRERGGEVLPVELTRHFATAISLAGAAPAVRWAQAAADADTARFAFADAADHLAPVRSAAPTPAAADRLPARHSRTTPTTP